MAAAAKILAAVRNVGYWLLVISCRLLVIGYLHLAPCTLHVVMLCRHQLLEKRCLGGGYEKLKGLSLRMNAPCRAHKKKAMLQRNTAFFCCAVDYFPAEGFFRTSATISPMITAILIRNRINIRLEVGTAATFHSPSCPSILASCE